MTSETMTLDEATAVLLDHCGREVEMAVEWDVGDTTASPVSAVGVLSHWSHEEHSAKKKAVGHSIGREDVRGLFCIGNASFQIDELSTMQLLDDDDEAPWGLVIRRKGSRDDCVRVTVAWGENR